MATTEATNTTVEVERAARGPTILAVVALIAGVAAYAAFGPPGRGGRPDLFGAKRTPSRAINYVEVYRGAPYAEAMLVQFAADGCHALVGGAADYVVVELERGSEIGRFDLRVSSSNVAASSSDGRYLAVVDAPPCFGQDRAVHEPVVFDCVARAPVKVEPPEALDPLDAAAFAAGGPVPVRWRAPGGLELRLWQGDGTDAPLLDVVVHGVPPANAAPRVVRRMMNGARGTDSTQYGPCVAVAYDAATASRLRRVETNNLSSCGERCRASDPGRRWSVDAERGLLARIVNSRVAVSTFDAPNGVVYEIGENVTSVGISEGRWLVGEADGYLRVFDGPREVSADRISLKPVRAFGGTASLRWAATFEPGELSDAPSDIGPSSRMRVTRLHRTDRALVFAGDDAREPTPVGGEIAAALGRVVVPQSDATVVYARDDRGALVVERLPGLPCGFDGRFLALADHDGFAAIFDLAEPIPRSPLRVPTRPMPDRLSAAVWSGATLLATASHSGNGAVRVAHVDGRFVSVRQSCEDHASVRWCEVPDAVSRSRETGFRLSLGPRIGVGSFAEADPSRRRLSSLDGYVEAELTLDGRLVRTRKDGSSLGSDALPDVDVATTEMLRTPDGKRFVLVEYRRVAETRVGVGVRSIRLGTFTSGLLRDAVFRPTPGADADLASSREIADVARSPIAYLRDDLLAIAMGDRVDLVDLTNGAVVGTLSGPAEFVAARREDDALAVGAGPELRIYRREL